jgi:hypothetical protein
VNAGIGPELPGDCAAPHRGSAIRASPQRGREVTSQTAMVSARAATLSRLLGNARQIVKPSRPGLVRA